VIVPEGVSVDLSGVVYQGELENQVASPPPGTSRFMVKIQGHAVLGDVEVRRPRPPRRRWRARLTQG
jgi:hypothetical protein